MNKSSQISMPKVIKSLTNGMGRTIGMHRVATMMRNFFAATVSIPPRTEVMTPPAKMPMTIAVRIVVLT